MTVYLDMGGYFYVDEYYNFKPLSEACDKTSGKNVRFVNKQQNSLTM